MSGRQGKNQKKATLLESRESLSANIQAIVFGRKRSTAREGDERVFPQLSLQNKRLSVTGSQREIQKKATHLEPRVSPSAGVGLPAKKSG